MPLNTYLNLNVEKKERVYQAVLNEYIRVPLEEVSIKNIVLNAGIPRGSFYQYFQDKEDALCFLISNTRTQKERQIIEDDKMQAFDVFDFIMHLCEMELLSLEAHTPSVRMQLLQQVAKSQRATFLFNEELAEAVASSWIFTKCLTNSSIDRLGNQEQASIMRLLTTSMKETLLSVLMKAQSSTNALQQLSIALNIIKNGVAALLPDHGFPKQ